MSAHMKPEKEIEGTCDLDRFKLEFGPYLPPIIPRTGRLFCEMRGYLRVGPWSQAPIPWPMRYRTGSIILCGDLIRAVKMESVEAVSHHWGVCRTVVQFWRKALGVTEFTPGTQSLKHRSRLHMKSQTQCRATIRACNPKAIFKRPDPESERRRPLVRPTTSAFVKARIERTGRHINPELRLWTEKEDRLLGTAGDQEIAQRIGRSAGAVQYRRNNLGIRAWNAKYERPWTPEEDALLGVVPDRELAKKLRRTFSAVQARREIKHLPPKNPQRRRFTPQEDAIVLAMSAHEAALKLGRSPGDIWARRMYIREKKPQKYPYRT